MHERYYQQGDVGFQYSLDRGDAREEYNAFLRHETAGPNTVRLVAPGGAVVVLELGDEGRSVVLRYEGESPGEVRVLEDAVSGILEIVCRPSRRSSETRA